jgi:hypothetical protein
MRNIQTMCSRQHINTPRKQFKRTEKILCGISHCLHILAEKWLHASAAQGFAVDEVPYCLKDKAKESQWAFELSQTMYGYTLSQRQQLLVGREFYITPHKSIKPPPNELVKIIALFAYSSRKVVTCISCTGICCGRGAVLSQR